MNVMVNMIRKQAQAQYVLDQIADAIARGNTLYRMPNVEEVEKELNKTEQKRLCIDCIYFKLPDNDPMCKECFDDKDKSYWQPKE